MDVVVGVLFISLDWSWGGAGGKGGGVLVFFFTLKEIYMILI